jgi:hypothetical protein
MKVWINKDLPNYKVGDLVYSRYHKNETVYRITKIERRFLLDQWDVRSHQGVWPGCAIGDEYNPEVTIEAVADLSIRADHSKKLRKSTKNLDAGWIEPVSSEDIAAHIRRLNDLLTTQFP